MYKHTLKTDVINNLYKPVRQGITKNKLHFSDKALKGALIPKTGLFAEPFQM